MYKLLILPEEHTGFQMSFFYCMLKCYLCNIIGNMIIKKEKKYISIIICLI